ncbi:polysaccharide deacetylase family protein [Brevibacillus sp. FSL L8-0520]|uniref:polysaccharide deacetylase family protein n=1 Tax=unclassified Brevibacillus TaxID=2684853 RepID=UPI0030CC1B9A
MTICKNRATTRIFARTILAATALVLLTSWGSMESQVNAAASSQTLNKPATQTARNTAEKSKAISMVYTTKRELALTFNGLGDAQKMKRLLDDLDTYKIKATFFLPGDKVAKQPALAKEIVARGHEIENNAVRSLDLTKLTYEQMDKEIKASQELIKQKTGIVPRYVRTSLGTYTDDVLRAAAHNGEEAVIGYSLFLHNWEKETDEQKYHYVRKYINRGGIIALDIEENKHLAVSIPLLAKAAADAGYEYVKLDKLIKDGAEKKPLKDIEGYDAAKINPDYGNASYKLVKELDTDEKKVALTFDDWGSDANVTKILDILDKHQVKATFFLRADGTVKNPNLARAMAEAGHDVANHTYSHPTGTEITPEQLQEEVVKAHQIITEAIQQKPAMLFRPPFGAQNEKSLKAIAATGYSTIAMFSVIPSDHDSKNSADDIVNAVLKQTKNGSVILLHMLDDIHTAEALPRIIEELQKQGYRFVKMTEEKNNQQWK